MRYRQGQVVDKQGGILVLVTDDTGFVCYSGVVVVEIRDAIMATKYGWHWDKAVIVGSHVKIMLNREFDARYLK